MYADRYVQPTRFSPGGLAGAVAITGSFIGALIFSAPIIDVVKKPPRTLTTILLEDPPPPPPVETPKPKPIEQRATIQTETITPPAPRVAIVDPVYTVPATPYVPPAGPVIGTAPTPTPAAEPAPPPPMPFVEASVDPRYANDLQPAYPPQERRAGNDGRVTVRVLIGPDGRVRDAQRVGATSDAFWNATLNQALRKWRFRPATRGGVPVEAWKTLSIRFVMEEAG